MNVHDANGYTPLHHAATRGHFDILVAFLNAGAHVNARATDGVTPLHDAVIGGHTDAAVALIKAGADVHAKNKYGRTPLHHAAFQCALSIVVALIEAGAMNIMDSHRNTPMDEGVQRRTRYHDTTIEYHSYSAVIECLENAQLAQEEEEESDIIFAEQVQLGDPMAAAYGPEGGNPFSFFPLYSFFDSH